MKLCQDQAKFPLIDVNCLSAIIDKRILTMKIGF